MRDLSRKQPALGPVVNPRYIVAASELVFGMARMFQEVGEANRPQLKVVRSLKEAYDELGIAAPSYQPLPEPKE